MKRKFKHKDIFKLTNKQVMMIEDKWYSKFNKEYYKQNTITIR